MALRKLSPGGYEYLTGSVACADRELEPGESLADYYLANGNPPGEWFGQGAQSLGVTGSVTQAQMTALFGEGRHPNADVIEARMIEAGASVRDAMSATQLGYRFPRYGGVDELRTTVIAAFQRHNREHGRPPSAPIDEATRTRIRQRVHRELFAREHGHTPRNEAQLSGWLAAQRRELKTAVAGFEMVFAPPKSVSIAWALADEPTRNLITGLHRQAVRDALTYFEQNAAFTRAGRTGEAQVDVNGISAALFEHWDSRTGDPHLHTHVPISTKVQRTPDGKWTALDGRTVYAAAVTVSEFYNSRLRDLYREHGATWTEKPSDGIDAKRPVWELDGVPQALLRGFSQRSRQVETDRARRIARFRDERGREPSPKELLELSRQAQYGSRTAKQPPRTLAEHTTSWRNQAARYVGPAVIEGMSQRAFSSRRETPIRPNIEVLAKATLTAVEEHHAHFNRWNIDAEAHRQTADLPLAPSDRDRVIDAVTATVIETDGTVALQPPPVVPEPAVLRRRDGQSVFVEHNSPRYTTERLLKAESDLVAYAHRSGGHLVNTQAVQHALAGQRLNAGQRHLVEQFATSGRRVQLALAPAGAGKTTAMRVFSDAWRTSGGRVFAFGPSARAAQELANSIGATPHTLHQLTVAPARFDFRPGDVVIIDEAAMAGTLTLHTVVTHALTQGADVRLVGDDHQLGAVEAGGAIRLIAHDVGAIRLDEVVRFRDPAQATASLQLRVGAHAALDYYFARDRIVGGSAETMRDAAQQTWRADLDAGRHALLIVPTNDDVTALNAQARGHRLHRGDIDSNRHVRLHDGTTASTGDWVVTRTNDRRLAVFGGRDFVKNGDTWTVTDTHPDGALAVVHRDHGGAVTLSADYVARDVELAYAATVHRVQGMTADTSHTLVPGTMTREQLYTAATRGRDTNHLYVTTHRHLADQHHETPAARDVRDVMTGVLDRVGTPASATELLRDSVRNTESLAVLVQRYNHAARLDDADQYRDLIARNAVPALNYPGEPALIQTLRNAHDLGRDPEQLLTNRRLIDGIDEGGDPAALLAWRIQQEIAKDRPSDRPNDERALPWQARINEATVDQHIGLRDYLRQLNDAIGQRAAHLRAETSAEKPQWTNGLDARPTNAAQARQWDHTAGLAAAYRETHNIVSSEPSTPIGPRPESDGLQARAWDDITSNWHPPVDHARRAANPRAINTLRHSLADLHDADDQRTGEWQGDGSGYDYYSHYSEYESYESADHQSGLGY